MQYWKKTQQFDEVFFPQTFPEVADHAWQMNRHQANLLIRKLYSNSTFLSPPILLATPHSLSLLILSLAPLATCMLLLKLLIKVLITQQLQICSNRLVVKNEKDRLRHTLGRCTCMHRDCLSPSAALLLQCMSHE